MKKKTEYKYIGSLSKKKSKKIQKEMDKALQKRLRKEELL